MDLAHVIREEAALLGFDPVRFARLPPLPEELGLLRAWIAAGHHAGMGWLERHVPLRADPTRLLPGARAVVVLGLGAWHPNPPPMPGIRGHVSRLAWGSDYHTVIQERLRTLVLRLEERLPGLRAWPTVDTRPVWERAWARRAGLGFPGRNGAMIVPGQGSFLFLAALLINQDLPPDPPLPSQCGACRACVDACPTGALLGNGLLDSRRCLSYHTIENRDPIPPEFASKMGVRLFGCDTCQDVCPHNKQPPTSLVPDFAPRPDLARPLLDEWLCMPDADLLAILEGTALHRSGPIVLKRNAALALQSVETPA